MNEVQQQLSQHKGAFAIVEGDSDARLYSSLFDADQCMVIGGVGQNSVIEAFEDLQNHATVPGLIGLVDSDFSRVDGILPSPSSMLATDSHDIETMVIASPALDKVLIELGSSDKIARFESENNGRLAEILLERVAPLGYLRWASEHYRLGYDFDELKFKNFFDGNSLKIDVRSMVAYVRDRSHKPTPSGDEVVKMMDFLGSANTDLWQVCCGHDLTEVLRIGFISVLGSHDRNELEIKEIERSLRLAYHPNYFAKTALYEAIKRWELDNRPFKLLSF